MSATPRLVLVAPPEVGYVFASVEAEFRARGVEVIRHTSEAAFLAAPGALADADILYCMGTLPVGRALMQGAARLRAIVTPFIGTDGFDAAAATELGIVIANGQVPENYLSMAEATIMLMLAALYNLRDKEDAFRRGLPRQQRQTARMIKGKMVGLVGFGRIARAVADRLLPWDVRIQAYAPRVHAPFPPHVARAALDELLAPSDIVSIHASLNDETRRLWPPSGSRCSSPMRSSSTPRAAASSTRRTSPAGRRRTRPRRSCSTFTRRSRCRRRVRCGACPTRS